MALAQGVLTETRRTLYRAPRGGAIVNSITLVNYSSGTGTLGTTFNLYEVRSSKSPIKIAPINTNCDVGDSYVDYTRRVLSEGDEIQGDALDGGVVEFTIN